MVKSHPILGGFIVVKIVIRNYNYNNILYEYKSIVVSYLRSDVIYGETKRNEAKKAVGKIRGVILEIWI
jgi:hypothetical protein